MEPRMALSVRSVVVIDRFHYNGDPFWDGDQTLYELDVVDGDQHGSVLVVVPRGNAFIPEQQVSQHVERLGSTLVELRASARRPGPNRRPQVVLAIDPGQA